MRSIRLCCRELSGLFACGILVALLAQARAATDETNPGDPSAQEILDRMAKVYANCKSYRDSGVVKTLFLQDNGKRTVEKPFTTAFERSGRFRFEYRQGLSTTNRYIIWSNGKENLDLVVPEAWNPKDGVNRLRYWCRGRSVRRLV